MKVYFIFIIALIFISESLAHVEKGQEKVHPSIDSTTRVFLVKANLTKEELLTLLHKGEKQLSNLRKRNEEANEVNTTDTTATNTTVEEVEDTYQTEQQLQNEIEDEIRDDALIPLHEFHVRQIKNSEVKSFVAKNNVSFIDSLYVKRFGKFSAFLTLLFSVFVVIYFTNLGNNKQLGMKRQYINYYDFDLSKDCMVEKNE